MKIEKFELNKKNIISLIIAIIFSIVTIWAAVKNVIINEKLFENSWNNYLALFLTITLMIFVFYKYKTDKKYVERLEERKQGKFKTFISILIAVPLFSKLYTDVVLIVILHTLSTGYSTDKIVYVEEVISQKNCRNGIRLTGYEMLGNGKVCSIPKDVLSKIEYGQKIILYGKETFFGFSPKKMNFEIEENQRVLNDDKWKKDLLAKNKQKVKEFPKEEIVKQESSQEEKVNFKGTHEIEKELEEFFKKQYFKSFAIAIDGPYKYTYAFAYNKKNLSNAHDEARKSCEKKRIILNIKSTCNAISDGHSINVIYDKLIMKNTPSKELTNFINKIKSAGNNKACEQRLFESTLDDYNSLKSLYKKEKTDIEKVSNKIDSINTHNYLSSNFGLTRTSEDLKSKKLKFKNINHKVLLIRTSWNILKEHCIDDKKSFAKDYYIQTGKLYENIKEEQRVINNFIYVIKNKKEQINKELRDVIQKVFIDEK